MPLRELIRIDEEKCDGCGECVPACAEGAIAIVDGKARLVSEVYCDGMGACLGHCPQVAVAKASRPVTLSYLVVGVQGEVMASGEVPTPAPAG